jgi:hypothetical protein
VRLVSCEGGIVPDAVHPPARALRTQSVLHRVDTAVVLQRGARSAQEDSGEGRHGVGPDWKMHRSEGMAIGRDGGVVV